MRLSTSRFAQVLFKSKVMKFKIDTKEKFHVLTLMEPILTVNIAAALTTTSMEYLQQTNRNIVLDLSAIDSIENEKAADQLAQLQQSFYESSASFVICNVQPGVEVQLEAMELLEIMNITPTETEAWDIVQLEEIERELLDDEEDDL